MLHLSVWSGACYQPVMKQFTITISTRVDVVLAAGIGGPDWYREKEKPVRSNLSGMCTTYLRMYINILLDTILVRPA